MRKQTLERRGNFEMSSSETTNKKLTFSKQKTHKDHSIFPPPFQKKDKKKKVKFGGAKVVVDKWCQGRCWQSNGSAIRVNQSEANQWLWDETMSRSWHGT